MSISQSQASTTEPASGASAAPLSAHPHRHRPSIMSSRTASLASAGPFLRPASAVFSAARISDIQGLQGYIGKWKRTIGTTISGLGSQSCQHCRNLKCCNLMAAWLPGSLFSNLLLDRSSSKATICSNLVLETRQET